MRKKLLILVALILALWAAQAQALAQPPTLYQYSTLEALASGAFAGDLSVAGLLTHGDFGLGTFNGVDGEMVVLDGRVYQSKIDCTLALAPPEAKTPFATVTFFTPQAQDTPPSGLDMAGLGAWLDSKLPGPRVFAAARITGKFAALSLRSAPKSQPPYPTLAQALGSQRIRELTNVDGTLVAIRCPKYADGLAVPGWHFHFVSADNSLGGHVLAARPDAVLASWMVLRRVVLDLPQGGEFDGAGSKPLSPQEMHTLEGGTPAGKP